MVMAPKHTLFATKHMWIPEKMVFFNMSIILSYYVCKSANLDRYQVYSLGQLGIALVIVTFVVCGNLDERDRDDLHMNCVQIDKVESDRNTDIDMSIFHLSYSENGTTQHFLHVLG